MGDVNLKTYNRKIDYLIFIIAILSIIVAVISLFYNQDINVGKQVESVSGKMVELYGRGIYHNDSLSMAVQAKGQDLVTLILGVPFLIYSLYLNKKGSLVGRFYITGTLAYFLYTYTVYCFAGSYNPLFIVYCAIMGTSFYAFVGYMTSFEIHKMKESFSDKLPLKYLGISNIVFAILIGLNWISRLNPSQTAEYLEHYTTLPIQAMDLGILLPTIIFSSVMIMKKKNWGYFLTPIVTFKGLTLLLALDSMIVFMVMNGVKVSFADIVIFPLYTIVVAFNFYLIQKHIK
jgi:hypothetical protein